MGLSTCHLEFGTEKEDELDWDDEDGVEEESVLDVAEEAGA